MTSSRLVSPILPRARIPGSTYRLQFNEQFTFPQAAAMVEYLRDLGVTDCYASPLFMAGPASTHGYDICSFEQLSSALGGMAGFNQLTSRLQELQLGLLLDMVPNHMGNDLSNAWWLDVLEHGCHSKFARVFDIRWHSTQPGLQGKILLPILEDEYAKVLESGKIRLVLHDNAFWVQYQDHRFPVSPPSYANLLEEIASEASQSESAGAAHHLARAFRPQSQPSEESEQGRNLKDRLRELLNQTGPFRTAVESVVRTYAGEAGNPPSFDRLAKLLGQQHYRLAFWKVGSEEINYRRFFDVTTLASVRMEDPIVFAACHRLVFELLKQGKISGLRIDHPDGLWDPMEYFLRLQAEAVAGFEGTEHGQPSRGASAAVPLFDQAQEFKEGSANQTGLIERRPVDPVSVKSAVPPRALPAWPLYVAVEKILSPGEELRSDWPVHGTTGYEFLNLLNGLFVDCGNEAALEQIYRAFTGNSRLFPDEAYAGKKWILAQSLISEGNALARQLKEVAAATRFGQDFTYGQLRAALVEIIAAFPVYRTYATKDSTRLISAERRFVEQAVATAQSRVPHLGAGVFGFIQSLLLLEPPRDLEGDAGQCARDFVLRFQQLTGPVTAKGLEDTAFYRYNRLVSLNEVGGDPAQFGIAIDQFHQANRTRANLWPHCLLATATHDTKRGEDARARINVLSEMPEEWRSALDRWSRLNAAKRSQVDGRPTPQPNDEYLLYQTLIGAWPIPSASPAAEPVKGGPGPQSRQTSLSRADLEALRDRIVPYLMKALKEAKDQTSWTDPNSAYEQGASKFVELILDPVASGKFLEDFQRFQGKVAFFGKFNSLSQLLLKITSPGVPDFYQGTELWDFNLVDPDNRRPVDYELRRRLLAQVRRRAGLGREFSAELARLLEGSSKGEVKLWVMARALAFRHRLSHLFQDGQYLPLAVVGSKRQHVCAFARVLAADVSLTVVPRLVCGLTGGNETLPIGEEIWGDTALEIPGSALAGSFVNVLTGEQVSIGASETGGRIPLSQALAGFPVGLLHGVRP